MRHLGKMRDHVGTRGAAELAEQIQTYWHSRGHSNVSVWTERIKRAYVFGDHDVSNWYAVRSNLIGGLPPPLEDILVSYGIISPAEVHQRAQDIAQEITQS